jgi:hypothetical protein
MRHDGVDIRDGARNRTSDSLDRHAPFTFGLAIRLPAIGHTALAWLKSVEPITHRWNANRAPDIRPEPDHAPAESEERALAARRTADCELAVERVESSTEEVVCRVQGAHCLGDIGFCNYDCAERLKEGDKWSVSLCWLLGQSSNSYARVDARDVEAVFD